LRSEAGGLLEAVLLAAWLVGALLVAWLVGTLLLASLPALAGAVLLVL